MVRPILCLAITMLLSGCSSLVLRDDDTTAQKSGKVATRIVLGIATLGLSELDIKNARKEIEARDDLEKYRDVLNRRIQEGKLTVYEAERLFRSAVDDANRQLAQRKDSGDVLQAVGAGLMMSGQAMQNAGPSYSAPPPPQIIRCTTSRMGNTLFTTCR